MTSIEDLKTEQGVPVVIANHEGLITYINPRFSVVFGWKPEEIFGKALTAIIPKNFHDAHHLGFSRFLATGQPTLLNRPLKLRAVTKDGREFEAEHLILAEQRDGQWIFGATIRPLSER